MATTFSTKEIQTKKSNTTYVKYSEAKKGDVLVRGTFLGTKMVPNFNKDGEVPSHSFETEKGISILNSSKNLNDLLEQNVAVGDEVEIIFDGTEKRKNKDGKHFKTNEFIITVLDEGMPE